MAQKVKRKISPPVHHYRLGDASQSKPSNLRSDEVRGYLMNDQQALDQYVTNRKAMIAEEKRMRDPGLSKVQKRRGR